MLAPLLPDNAPFTPEQRAWLNGFFAGLLSFDTPAAAAATAQALVAPPAALDPLADGDDGSAPWRSRATKRPRSTSRTG